MAEKKIKNNAVGKVTESEKDEIKFLFERKNGLNELFKSLNDPSHPLYDRIVQDMGATSTKYQKWWDDMSVKYKWKGKPGHSWRIDFETGEIFLTKN